MLLVGDIVTEFSVNSRYSDNFSDKHPILENSPITEFRYVFLPLNRIFTI